MFKKRKECKAQEIERLRINNIQNGKRYQIILQYEKMTDICKKILAIQKAISIAPTATEIEILNVQEIELKRSLLVAMGEYDERQFEFNEYLKSVPEELRYYSIEIINSNGALVKIATNEL